MAMAAGAFPAKWKPVSRKKCSRPITGAYSSARPVSTFAEYALAGGCWSRRQVSDWIDAGGNAPRLCTDEDWKKSERRRRARRLKAPLTIGITVLLVTLGCHLGHAHDPSHPELKAWFDSLKRREGAVLLRRRRHGGQRRRLAIRQWPLSRTARWRMDRCTRRSRDHRTEPGWPNHGVAVARLYGHDHPLLHARQHDLERDDAASKGAHLDNRRAVFLMHISCRARAARSRCPAALG